MLSTPRRLRPAVLGLPLLLAQAAPALAADPPPPPPASAANPATNPNLEIATLKLTSGIRASKVIGATVHNAQDERIGTVDDVILTQEDKASLVVISVGGFLGIGNKLVAIPYARLQLRRDNDHDMHVVLPDGTKDGLNGMPSFTYSGN